MGCTFFPRVLIQLIGLKGGATHCSGWRGLIQVGLNTLPRDMELFP
jgi:hypothetical protein